MSKKKKKVDINANIEDPESIENSKNIYHIGARLKQEDFTRPYTI